MTEELGIGLHVYPFGRPKNWHCTIRYTELSIRHHFLVRRNDEPRSPALEYFLPLL